MFICEIWLFDWYFSSILQIWYVEVRISRSVLEGPFEITRVDSNMIFWSSRMVMAITHLMQMEKSLSDCDFAGADMSFHCSYFS